MESLRHVAGQFPPYERCMPKQTPTAAVYIDPAILGKMCESLVKLSVPDSSGKMPGITLEIHDQYKSSRRRLRNCDGSSADGLVMAKSDCVFPLPITKKSGTTLSEPQVDPEANELALQVERLKEQLADAQAEIARLRAESKPAVTWKTPETVVASPIGVCAGCRKSFKYLKSAGQSCTRCLKKHGPVSGVVRE